LALSPSGKEFVRSDPGRIAKVYDAATGKESRDLPGQKGESPSVALFSSDGKIVVLGSQAAIVAVDFLAGKELQRWKGRALGENIALRRDGKMIATVDPGKGTVRILNVETGAEKDAGLKAKSEINALAWSPDGSRIATAGSDGSISVWETDSGKLSKEVGSGAALMAGGMSFSPDGKLFGALKDNSVTIWDAETWKELSRVAPTDRSFLFLPDGKRVVSSWGPSVWRVRE
jgi:WD40 repeat protein